MTVAEADRMGEVRRHKHNEQGGMCWVCHRSLWGWKANPQLAHRIPQRKWCIKKWGKAVIHHPRNMVLVCGIECNAKAQLNPESLEAAALAEDILRGSAR